MATQRVRFGCAGLAGDVKAIDECLKNGVDINARPGSSWRTALWNAVSNDHISAVGLLVHRKADVDLRDTTLNTPLAVAATHGRRLMCEILLQAGADQTIMNGSECVRHGFTAASCAFNSGYKDLCDFIRSWPSTLVKVPYDLSCGVSHFFLAR